MEDPATDPVPKTGTGGGLRKSQSTANKVVDLEKSDAVLFEDGERRDNLLKGLIDIAGLRNAWDGLSKRLAALEKAGREQEAERQAKFQETYVSLEDYDQFKGKYLKGVKEHTDRLRKLEDYTFGTQPQRAETIAEDCVMKLEHAESRISIQEETIAKVFEEIEDVKSKEERIRRTVLLPLKEVEKKTEAQANDLKVRASDLQGQLGNQLAGLKSLQATVAEHSAFLAGPPIREQVETLCKEVQSRQLAKDDLLAEALESCKQLNAPLRSQMQSLSRDVDIKVNGLAKTDNQLRKELQEVRQITSAQAEHLQELARETNARLETCADKIGVQTQWDQIDDRFRKMDSHHFDLREMVTHKLREMVERIRVLQSIFTDHEHALQHHAEEMLNRSTKYDIVLVNNRIDLCARKDKVESEIKEIMTKLTWQNGKMEQLLGGGGGGLGLRQRIQRMDTLRNRDAKPGPASANAADGYVAESPPTSRSASPQLMMPSPASAAPGPPKLSRARTQPFGQPEAQLATGTLENNLLKQQLENLARGVVALGHLLVMHHGASIGLSREVREHRADECLHHLECVLEWITHRIQPPDFDETKLTTLALHCSRLGDDAGLHGVCRESSGPLDIFGRPVGPSSPRAGKQHQQEQQQDNERTADKQQVSVLSGGGSGSTEVGTWGSDISSPMQSLSTSACKVVLPAALPPRRLRTKALWGPGSGAAPNGGRGSTASPLRGNATPLGNGLPDAAPARPATSDASVSPRRPPAQRVRPATVAVDMRVSGRQGATVPAASALPSAGGDLASLPALAGLPFA
jgi:hypothetical protein